MSVRAMVGWLLGQEGGRDNFSPRKHARGQAARLIHGEGNDDEEEEGGRGREEDRDDGGGGKKEDEGEEGGEESAAARLDFASKSLAYQAFRNAWEDKHGLAARKEREMERVEGSGGATWTRADPQPFRVVRLRAGAPPTPGGETQ